jgi:hypothetical protein
MVRRGGFLKGMSAALDRPVSAVTLYYRFLSEQCLITRTGARGKSAPEMTPLDAVRVAIAMLVTEKPSLASTAVKDFGSLNLTKLTPKKTTPSAAAHHARLATILSDKTVTLEAILTRFVEALAKADAQIANEIFLRIRFIPSSVRVTIIVRGLEATFSNQKEWLEILNSTAAGNTQSNLGDAHRNEIRRSFETYKSHGIKTERHINGAVLADIAAMFRGSQQEGGGDK